MLAVKKALGGHALTSKLEVERKFVPSPLLKKLATENATTPRITLTSSQHDVSSAALTRLPRKRILDKYFDQKGQLERKGIWVRWRKQQDLQHDGTSAASSHAFWEAKIKQGGTYLDSQFVEAKGREAVEMVMAEGGVCDSIYDLTFKFGFVADRVSWSIGNGHDSNHDAEMTILLDTVSAALEGNDSELPRYMHHQVGELELEKTITTCPAAEKDACFNDEVELTARHHAIRASEAKVMRTQLSTLMAAHPAIFDGEGSPLGKVTAYMQQKSDKASRVAKANAKGRLANMSELQYEKLNAISEGRMQA